MNSGTTACLLEIGCQVQFPDRFKREVLWWASLVHEKMHACRYHGRGLRETYQKVGWKPQDWNELAWQRCTGGWGSGWGTRAGGDKTVGTSVQADRSAWEGVMCHE